MQTDKQKYMPDTSFIIGNRVRELRKARGLSQDDLAAMTGLEHSYISYIESGKRNPTLKTLHRIAVSLEVPLTDLVKSEL